MSEFSPDTIAIIGGMLLNFAGMSIWFGRIIGRVTAQLTDHEKRHIRHELRLDNHTNEIEKHGKHLAVLADREQRAQASDV